MAVESIPNKELDTWIENLSNCKQLEETEVKRLTDKVSWPKESSVVFVGRGRVKMAWRRFYAARTNLCSAS